MRGPLALVAIVLVVLVGFGGCAGVSSYNSLVAQDEAVERSWGDLQAQYQRRADLVPNLVATVQAAGDFERSTLDAVVSARARATSINLTVDDLNDPERIRQFQEAQGQLGSALGRLMAITENYPQLRAVEGYRDLSAQLEGTENRLAYARRDFNGAVQQYNTAVRRFPTSIFAGMMGFDRRHAFSADPGSERAPTVDFSRTNQ
jgi:LemA protein